MQNKGQAIISLLFFMIIAVTITSAAVIIVFSNSLAGTKFEQGVITNNLAESGIENALLKLLRNPDYTGETMNFESGTVSITVTGSSSKTITAKSVIGNITRTLETVVTYNNNILSIVSWKEI